MLKFLEWLATAVTLAGTVLTSLALDPWNIYVLNLGSALWVLWAAYEGRRSIVMVNLGMLVIYAVGIVSRT